ncbi:MAG: Processing alpha glucosidase I [Thelocarpon superellum]|nr:MAG: Processing alpha glucosidase I [Thelocarpon superellum]
MLDHGVRCWTALLAVLSLALVHRCHGDQAVLKNDIGRASNESLLWGPYRPNLYFGVRPRIPKSLMTGLLWSRVEDFQSVQENFRHTCEQHEGMDGYGWEEYDVRAGGRQVVHDAGNQIDMENSFVKVPGGSNGGSWGVRVKGVPRSDAPPNLKTTVVFYATMEGLGSLEVMNEQDARGFEGTVTLHGSTAELGEFAIDITTGPESNVHPEHSHPAYEEKPLDRTMVLSTTAPEHALWQAKSTLFAHLKESIGELVPKYGEQNMPPPFQVYTIANRAGDGNLHYVQKVFEGAFEFDILYSSASAGERLTSDTLTEHIKAAVAAFQERFAGVFPTSAPFDQASYQQFAKELFSNLLGGIGYFYGDAVVDRSYAEEYEEVNEGFWEETAEARGRNNEKREGPYELFTSIPSRPFFPRGFLWDEGFHLLPIIDYDTDLALEIVQSWFKLMDDDGWIGREQILGDEARSKVPREFQTQYPHYANPPTLFLVLEAFMDKLSVNAKDKAALQYLRELYPLLRRHYLWYRRTQWGDIKSYEREAFSSKEGYRWRGRTPQHILTSGQDDYPRPQPPHPGELHLDLMSWMGMMTRSMKRVARTIGETDDAEEFAGYEEGIVRNIEDLHWDEKAQTYCDATIDDYDEHVHVCHKGYVSLFPFMTGLLTPKHPHLGAILNLIEDPEELWTDYGIRSLSKSDEFYGTEENYWRSPIWVNMNYLILTQLYALTQSPGPHTAQATRLYNSLRRNLVSNVHEQWQKTGFAWEQYNPDTGAGQRTQHFTGWTSLVVKVMALPEVGGGVGEKVKKVKDEVREGVKKVTEEVKEAVKEEKVENIEDEEAEEEGHDEL